MTKYLFLSLLTLFIVACGSDSSDQKQAENSSKNTSLTIQRAPINGQPVSINQNISLTFSTALNPTSVTTNSAYILDLTNTDVIFETALDLDDTNATINFLPYTYFNPSTTYQIVVTTTIEDTLGNNLIADYTYTFTTAADPIDTTPLDIRSVKPDINSTATLIQTEIVIEFNKNLSTKPQYTGSTYISLLNNTTGNIVSGHTEVFNSLLKFIPDVPLEYNTDYNATLVRAVFDLHGNDYVSPTDYTWGFTTKEDLQSPKSDGHQALSTLDTGINSYYLAQNGSKVVVAREGGIDLYRVIYGTVPSLDKLDSETIPSTITSITMNASYILLSTSNNGIYLYDHRDGFLVSLGNYISSSSIYGVNFGEFDSSRIYAVGPDYGLDIFNFDTQANSVTLFSHTQPSATGVALDVVEVESYDSVAQQTLKKLYVADYDGGVVILDINGTYISRTDLNASIKKLTFNEDYNGKMGLFAIASSGKVLGMGFDGLVYSNVKSDLPGSISDVSSHVDSINMISNLYYSNYKDGIIKTSGDYPDNLVTTNGSVVSTVYIDPYKEPIDGTSITEGFLIALNEDGKIQILNEAKDSVGPVVGGAYTNPLDTATNVNPAIDLEIEIADNYLDSTTVSQSSFVLWDNNTNSSVPFVYSSYYSSFPNSYVARLNPDNNLTAGGSYTIIVDSNISDMFGLKFNNGADQNISFTVQ